MGRINNRYKRDMKQTAVEWLWLNLTDDIIGDLSPHQIHSVYKLVELAKEMEKEQIIDALMTSEVELLSWGISAEQYYNETFKSE